MPNVSAMTDAELAQWVNEVILPMTKALARWTDAQELDGGTVRIVLCSYLGAMVSCNTKSTTEAANFIADLCELISSFYQECLKQKKKVLQ